MILLLELLLLLLLLLEKDHFLLIQKFEAHLYIFSIFQPLIWKLKYEKSVADITESYKSQLFLQIISILTVFGFIVLYTVVVYQSCT